MQDTTPNAAIDLKGKSRAAIIASFIMVTVIACGVYACVASALHSKSTMSALILRPVVGADKFYDQELVPGIKKQSLFVTAMDGSKLHAWLFKLPGTVSRRLALVSHGNAGNVSNRIYLANALTESGCSVLLYDYRGYGLSSGKSSLDSICDDGATMYSYAINDLGYRPNQVVLYGESIGTAVTCSLAANLPCAGVILQSGFTSLPSVVISSRYANFSRCFHAQQCKLALQLKR
jgi:pimeloyl-ACP methyl ester carboxylesterase